MSTTYDAPQKSAYPQKMQIGVNRRMGMIHPNRIISFDFLDSIQVSSRLFNRQILYLKFVFHHFSSR